MVEVKNISRRCLHDVTVGETDCRTREGEGVEVDLRGSLRYESRYIGWIFVPGHPYDGKHLLFPRETGAGVRLLCTLHLQLNPCVKFFGVFDRSRYIYSLREIQHLQGHLTHCTS